MSTNWDLYKNRLNVNGETYRDRQANRLKVSLENHMLHSLSTKDVPPPQIGQRISPEKPSTEIPPLEITST